jgi:hypothetical protein
MSEKELLAKETQTGILVVKFTFTTAPPTTEESILTKLVDTTLKEPKLIKLNSGASSRLRLTKLQSHM